MTHSEPEWLALELQQLIERRTKLRTMLEAALLDVLTDEERDDLHAALAATERDMRDLEGRLARLIHRPAAGSGGTG